MFSSAQCSSRPGRDGLVHLSHELGEHIQFDRVAPLGNETGGDRAQAFEQREDVEDRLAGHRRDRGADVRDVGDEPFGLEQLQRLANRDDADLEPACEVIDHQPLAGSDLAAHDRRAQGLVDELLLGAWPRRRARWHRHS